MIIAFTGTPGSGKSYEAVKKILDNLKKGRTVYTNIEGFDTPICVEAQKAFVGIDDYEYSQRMHFLSATQVKEFWLHCKRGSLIIIDEAQNFFNSRDWQAASNREFGQWSSVHRHEGYDLVLLTHETDKIDKAVRSLIEWSYDFRKVNYFGDMVKNKYKCNAYVGEDITGKPFAQSVRSYNQEIFLCYRSYVAQDVKELGIMKHVNILKHPVFFILPLVLALTLYLLFYKSSFATGDVFGSKKIINKNIGKKDIQKIVNNTHLIEFKDLMNSPEVKMTKKNERSDLIGQKVLDKNEEIEIIELTKKDNSCYQTGYIEYNGDVFTINPCTDGISFEKNGIVTFKTRRKDNDTNIKISLTDNKLNSNPLKPPNINKH